MAKIILSDERTEGITKGNVKAGPWAKFKFLYGLKPGLNRPNITMLLFFIPLLAAVFYDSIAVGGINGSMPYYSYIGVGSPPSLYVAGQANMLLQNNTKLFLLLITAGAAIFSVAFSGALKIIRNGLISIKVDKEGNATSEISHKRDLKRGIKQNWYICLSVILFWALIANGIFYLFILLETSGIEGFPLILILIFAFIFAALAVIYGMFVMTLSAGYNQSLGKILKNAFFMTFQNMLSNTFVLVLTIAPLSLLLLNTYLVSLIVLVYYAMIGFSATVFFWTYQSLRIESRYPKYKTINNAGKEEPQN